MYILVSAPTPWNRVPKSFEIFYIIGAIGASFALIFDSDTSFLQRTLKALGISWVIGVSFVIQNKTLSTTQAVYASKVDSSWAPIGGVLVRAAC